MKMKKTLLAILIGATLAAPATSFASGWRGSYSHNPRHAYYGRHYRHEGYRYGRFERRHFRRHHRRHWRRDHRRDHRFRDHRWGHDRRFRR